MQDKLSLSSLNLEISLSFFSNKVLITIYTVRGVTPWKFSSREVTKVFLQWRRLPKLIRSLYANTVLIAIAGMNSTLKTTGILMMMLVYVGSCFYICFVIICNVYKIDLGMLSYWYWWESILARNFLSISLIQPEIVLACIINLCLILIVVDPVVVGLLIGTCLWGSEFKLCVCMFKWTISCNNYCGRGVHSVTRVSLSLQTGQSGR